MKPVLNPKKHVDENEDKGSEKPGFFSRFQPFIADSSYRKNFIDFSTPVVHERSPIFPVY